MARDNAQDKAVSHRKAILHLKKSDPILADIIARIGPCRLEFGEPTFHALAESILYQQLNGKAAATIFDRFTALAGDPLTPLGILKLMRRCAAWGCRGRRPRISAISPRRPRLA